MPNSASISGAVTAVTLIDCIAASPCAAGRRRRAAITNVENAKNTPPTAAAADRCGDGERDERAAHRLAAGDGVPRSGRRGLGRVGREVARLAPERLAHAVGRVRVAAVDDLAEQVREQVHDIGRHAVVAQLGRVLLERDRHVAERAPARGRDDGGGVRERQRVRAGELVEPADVAVVGERGDGDVGEVVDIEERRGHVTARQPDLAAEHVLEHVVLAEVLHEPDRSAGSVSSAPVSRTACSARSASGSPRPDSSAIRGAPLRTASAANSPTASTAPGTAMSG